MRKAILLIGAWVFAQNADLFLGSEAYPLLERWQVRGWLDTTLPGEVRPWAVEEAQRWLSRTTYEALPRLEKARYDRLAYIIQDTLPARKGRWLRFLFPEGRDLIAERGRFGEVYIGPLAYFALGRDSTGLLYQNTRGAYLRMKVGHKLGFYADIIETQSRPPFFVRQRYDQYATLWGEAYLKPFRSGAFDHPNTRGYLTYSPIEAVRIKLGRDKVFWGPGFQSLWLSDYAPEYLHLHVRTRVARWEYHNLFAQLVDEIPFKPDIWGDHPRKYLAAHLLLWRPSSAFTIGAFEAVMYNPWTPRGTRGIELSYFIPIIFYRTIEQMLGSPDNAMLGALFKANLLKRFQLYGQLALDDYNFGMRRRGRGWWGNKYAWQVGIKGFDLGLPSLDLQVEYNHVRPYTYSHSNVGAAWHHYRQFLAHPYGANLQEVSALMRYQPLPGLTVEGRLTLIEQGLNRPRENWGSNILISDVSFMQEFGNKLLQGERVRYTLIHGKLIYQPRKLPLYMEGEGFYRGRAYGIMAGIRWMFVPKMLRF
ncbi:MAG: hypothetical protein NZ580_05625 [Bacteroidia bacterium]|nr:hypothetical protein [Bacteroidia bacterium]MDW8236043.1 hypothetical protein [Bacteroidia bacterium]